MMIISIISLILSLLIQGIISNFVGYTFMSLSLFYTVYVLVCLGVILPYFDDKKKYFILLIIFGLIIDIAYTNTFILNVFIFIVVYFFNKIFYAILPYNLFTINISSVASIIIYHIISFLMLLMLGYDNYTISMLGISILHSIIMTVIYASSLYLIINFIYKKFELKEVR